MPTICTSCGVQIPPSLIIYKCRQCVHHFICELCERKDHNRASAAFHTLEKIFVPNARPTNSVVATSKIDKKPKAINKNTSSIFTSDAYLYSLLGFCDHCYRFFGDKEENFQCEQCPNNFAVCSHCYPLISTHHPSVHTFSKKSRASIIANVISNFNHFGISCDGCSKESFDGRRYQCEECSPSYDLCEDCYGKKHTHHRFKYIQHPALHANNQQMLGLRTLMLAEKNGNNNWRDPLTGWTKSDAEQIIQQAKQEKQNYDKRFEETMGELRALSLQSQMNLQQSISDSYRMMARTWW